MRGAGAKIARDVNHHALADEPGSGKEVENFFPTARRVPGLFKKFAFRARKRLLARLDPSGDQFPQIAADGMTILANEQQSPVVEDGKDDDGAVVHDDIACGADTAGLNDRIAANVEDASVEERFAGNGFRASDGSLR